VRLDIVAGSSRTVDGSLAPGQIASYVAHGRAGEILDLTVRSNFDNGVLSVSGLTDGMTLVSRREYATQRSLVLPSEQDYSIKVVSLAGYAARVHPANPTSRGLRQRHRRHGRRTCRSHRARRRRCQHRRALRA